MGGEGNKENKPKQHGPTQKILSLYSIFLVLHFAFGGPYATVCKRDSQLYKKCLKILTETSLAVQCAEQLSDPRYSEVYYMDCLRDSFPYSNACDSCICTRLQRV